MLQIENNFKWISSLGGPFILMPKSLLPFWNGDDRSEEINSSDYITDYDMLSDIEDYARSIVVGDGTALVLNDLPSDTAYIKVNPKTVLFVRWIWAENEEQVKQILMNMSLTQKWIDTGIKILFKSEELFLFDSVYSGKNFPDALYISIETGVYEFSTLSYQPNEQVNLFLILMTMT